MMFYLVVFVSLHRLGDGHDAVGKGAGREAGVARGRLHVLGRAIQGQRGLDGIRDHPDLGLT